MPKYPRILYRFFKKVKPLKPGTYLTTLQDVKTTNTGMEIILSNIKKEGDN